MGSASLLGLLALTVGGHAVSAAGSTADVDPPDVTHTPCSGFAPGSPIEVRARISDTSALFDPAVFYRAAGSSQWLRQPLKWTGEANDFSAVLAVDGSAAAVEYLIEVFDEAGNGPARVGTPVQPIRLAPSAAAVRCEQVPPAAAPRPSGLAWLVRLEPAAGFLLSEPQSRYYGGVGGAFMARAGAAVGPGSSVRRFVAAEVEAGWIGFPARERAAGGGAYVFGAGVRLQSWLDGWAVPYVDAHGGVVNTGPLNRFAFDAAVGLDVETTIVAIGPCLRYTQIVDLPRVGPVREDARILSAGVGASFDVWQSSPSQPAVVSTLPLFVDADSDGLPDSLDKCLHEAEDRDGFADDDGCPDPDNDQDGVADADDRCPLEAEDRDGFADDDGCPDFDNDQDGVADADDRCPLDAEDRDGFADDDGCPDPDNDQDGVPDAMDRCPDEPETFNDEQDDDGCPDAVLTSAYANMAEKKIIIQERVYFKFAMHRLEVREQKALDAVARILKRYPQIRKIRIEGHTDDVGSDPWNMKLSQRRAFEVMAYLIKGGVEPGRLEAKGYGRTRPLVPSQTTHARDVNRRVEFMILESESLISPP